MKYDQADCWCCVFIVVVLYVLYVVFAAALLQHDSVAHKCFKIIVDFCIDKADLKIISSVCLVQE